MKPLILLGMERVKGIEPSSQPWEGHILPLNHTRAARLVTNHRAGRNRFEQIARDRSRSFVRA